MLTFLIKIKEHGRGSVVLSDIVIGASVEILGGFGLFHLAHTSEPKIFIATGTGLAPIYAMIQSLPQKIKKSLYFSVSTLDDLFYEDQLRAIPNLDLHIHITQGEESGYESGRINIDTITATPETEWYICGNPSMLAEARVKLEKRALTQVYFEEF